MNVANLLEHAKARGIMIATAESCTGGMVAAALTDIPGSSAVVERGFVTYTNTAKQEMLGVAAATLAAMVPFRNRLPGKWPTAHCGFRMHPWRFRSQALPGRADQNSNPKAGSVSGWQPRAGTQLPKRSNLAHWGVIACAARHGIMR